MKASAFFFIVCLISFNVGAYATDQPDVKKNTVKNIGGLLFDVDEGVDVEKGPGGSVYVKSNKDYMQKKFTEIEQRFNSMEMRVAALEGKQNDSEQTNAQPSSGSLRSAAVKPA
jgi:hypothetical protein